MKYLFFLYLLLISVILLSQQGLSNNWLLASANPSNNGYCIRFNFNSSDVNIDSFYCNTRFSELSSNISNALGNILFYTNGIAIFNAQGDTMLNGANFNPGYATTYGQTNGLGLQQSCLIVPFPYNHNKYYLFHETFDPVGNNNYMTLRLAYSIIDMSLDNGKGAVISKNVTAINDTVGSRITAVKHGNGLDWWVVKTIPNQSKMYVLLLTFNGIGGIYEQYILGEKWGTLGDGGGQSAFSPDGTMYAKWDNETKKLHILDFDRCTGLFSNHISFSPAQYNPYSFYGLAFSPNSQVLYLNKNDHIEQFDMMAANIPASATVVATYDGFVDEYGWQVGFGYACSLAPDGKIYTNSSNPTRHLNVIDNPNVLGIGCNVQQHSIKLPFWNGYTLPIFPNYDLGALVGSACDSLLSNQSAVISYPVQVYPNPAQDMLSLSWEGNSAIQAEDITIYDSFGREIAKKLLYLSHTQAQVQVNDLAEGVYMFKLSQKQSVYYGKFVIQR